MLNDTLYKYFEDVIFYQFIYTINVTVLVTSLYTSVFISLLSLMRRSHQMAYKDHRNRMIILFVATELSLLLALAYSTWSVWTIKCLKNFPQRTPMNDPWAALFYGQEIGMCERVVKNFLHYTYDTDRF